MYERVGISLVEVHEKLEISVIRPKGLTDVDRFLRDRLLGQVIYLLFIYKMRCIYSSLKGCKSLTWYVKGVSLVIST